MHSGRVFLERRCDEKRSDYSELCFPFRRSPCYIPQPSFMFNSDYSMRKEEKGKRIKEKRKRKKEKGEKGNVEIRVREKERREEKLE